jgi:hypothetical protein
MFGPLKSVMEAWESCNLVRGEIPIAICEFLDESNVDLVIDELPEPYRGEFLEWAADATSTPPEQWRLVRLGTHLQPPTADEQIFQRRHQVHDALKGWFQRHPDEKREKRAHA